MKPVEAQPDERPVFRSRQDARDYAAAVTQAVAAAERKYQEAIARGECPYTNDAHKERRV